MKHIKMEGMKPGFAYLTKDEKLFYNILKYQEEIRNCFCVTRLYPRDLYEMFNIELKNTDAIRRISSIEERDTYDPTQIQKIVFNIGNFCKTKNNPVIFLSGIDYLISKNDETKPVLNMIHDITDYTKGNDAIFLVHVNPNNLDKQFLGHVEDSIKIYVKRSWLFLNNLF